MALTQVVQPCPSGNLVSRQSCYKKHILLVAAQHPEDIGKVLNGIWALSTEDKLSGDPRAFSDTAHYAGMQLENDNVDIQTAFSYCGDSFKAGCMHGFVMEYVDDYYPGIAGLQNALNVCDVFHDVVEKSNCIHGLGHEIAAKTTNGLVAGLQKCMIFSQDMQPDCESGVMMEYTKGTAGSGHHSHVPVGQLKLPCPTLPQSFQAVCYSASASYRQYYPNEEPFSTTYQYCVSAPNQYQADCLAGLSERVIMSVADNGNKAKAICQTLGNLKGACLNSLIETSKTEFRDPVLTHDLENTQ